MKACSRCKAEKPLAEFNRRTDSRDGRSYICRDCQRDVAAQHYVTHKVDRTEKVRIWREANPDRVTAARRVRLAALRAADPVAYRERERRAWLWFKYKITPEEFDALLARQHGRCGICGTADLTADGKPFRVDHDHVTGKVRGILCHLCNVLLGAAHDDPARLQSAIDYLNLWPAAFARGASRPLG